MMTSVCVFAKKKLAICAWRGVTVSVLSVLCCELNKYFVKPPEVHSLLRVPGRRREKSRSLTGDGDWTIPAVASSLLQCQTLTDQSTVSGRCLNCCYPTDCVWESQISPSQPWLMMSLARKEYLLSAPSSFIYRLVIKECSRLSKKLCCTLFGFSRSVWSMMGLERWEH